MIENTDGTIRKDESNAIRSINIDTTETIAFEAMEDGTHVKHKNKNTELRRSVQVMEWTVSQEMSLVSDRQKRVQCSMSDIEGPNNTAKHKTQDVCEKLQKTHAKLKNKNAKLRRSVKDMNRTLCQEKHIVSDLHKRVQCLELELERTLDVNKQLQSDIEKLQNMSSNIHWENEQLVKSLNDMTRTQSHEKEIISDLQQRLNSLVLGRESTLAVNKKLQNDIEILHNMHSKCQWEKGQLEKTLNDMDRTLSQEKETVSDLQSRTDSLVLERESILAVNKQLQSDIETLQNMYSNSQWKNGQLEKSLNDMDRTLTQEKETVSDLQNRLSKLAGDILTHENTNITDLSDPNRPMKLSETYSELYDNEWTDAFEELTGRGLTDILAIGKLRDMLLFSFRKCRDVTWERYQSLKSTMSTVDIVHVLPSMRDFTEPEEKTETTSNESELTSHNETYNSIAINSEAQNKEETYRDKCAINASRETEIVCQRNKEGERTSESKKEHLTCTATLTVEQEKEIKKIWRTTTNALMDEAVRNLHIVLLTKFDISIEDSPNTCKYLARCIDLCWKMGVQEKPMYLDACDEKCDGCENIFNHDKYRAYTQTGKKVAFVVWPALFLHEGGAMLVKGIAQGCQ